MSTFQIDFGNDRNRKIVGIDLGTTNSLVAVMELTGPRILSRHRAQRGFGDAIGRGRSPAPKRARC